MRSDVLPQSHSCNKQHLDRARLASEGLSVDVEVEVEVWMGPTNSSVNNQVAKLEVGGVVAVNPCRGPNSLGQQLHGATTPVLEDPFRSTTNTHSAHSYGSTTNTYRLHLDDRVGCSWMIVLAAADRSCWLQLIDRVGCS